MDFSVNGNGDIEFKILDGDSVVASSRAQSATATLTVEAAMERKARPLSLYGNGNA
ncbi:MAG: hypothetical protein ACLR6O_06370 [Eubacterium sp.]